MICPALPFLFAVKWDLMSDHLVFPLKWKHGSYVVAGATGRGGIGGKTGKTLVLPGFRKIERGRTVMVVLPSPCTLAALV